MINRISLAIVATLSLSLIGCKDDKKGEGGAGAGKVASCNMPSAGLCTEYRGGNLALGTESLAKLCMPEISESAKFSETACPTDKLVATCAKPEGKEFFYEGSVITPEESASMCKDRGGTYATAK
jgi:hypothetical protein